MNKKQVQSRISQNGKPLELSKFTWDESTNFFSSAENGLVIDFKGIDGVSFTTGWNCTFKTGWNCTFKTGSYCTFTTGTYCTFTTGSYCTFKTGSYCTFKTGSYCTFKTGWGCTFKTGWNCTFKTDWGCTFKTGTYCTFTTDWGCTFTTGWNCTFKTDWGCTFTTGTYCTFTTGKCCVIVRRDVFEVIQPEANKTYQLCPYEIPGYLTKDGDKWFKDGVEHIIVDGILSKVISRHENVFKVVNHGETKESYIVFDEDLAAHGDTIEEARKDLVYKIGNIDTSIYKDLTLDSVKSFEEVIKMYRAITGACAKGTRHFVESLKEVKTEYSIREVIEITQGQYNSDKFKMFFVKGK